MKSGHRSFEITSIEGKEIENRVLNQEISPISLYTIYKARIYKGKNIKRAG